MFSSGFVIFSTLLTFTQLDSDFKSTWKIFYWCSNYDFVFPGQLFGSDAPCSGFETRSAVQAVTTLLSFSLLPFVQQAHPCLMLLDTHIQTRIKHTHTYSIHAHSHTVRQTNVDVLRNAAAYEHAIHLNPLCVCVSVWYVLHV